MSTTDRAPVCTKEQQLRTAIALNRAIVLMEGLGKKLTIDPTGMEGLFQEIHGALFKDGLTDVGLAPADPNKREALRVAIQETLFAPQTGLFNRNPNYVRSLHHEELAKIFAKFYAKVHEINPYDFGNKLTLDLFVTGLTRMPAFAEANPSFAIDFRRLNSAQLKTFRNTDATEQELTHAFMAAMDPSIGTQHALPNAETPLNYPTLPENKIEIAGVRFLTHKEGNAEYLVTVNGGLVSMEKYKPIVAQYLRENKMLSEFPPIEDGDIKGYLPGTEALHNKPLIDGIPRNSLLCMDINIMSGLRGPSHKEVIDLLQNKLGKAAQITALNKRTDDTRSKEDFLNARVGEIKDPLLKAKVSIAYDHVNVNVKRLDELVEEKLKGLSAAEGAPKFCMTMGGSGSGKSLVKKMFTKQCGGPEHFIETSLDGYRADSDIYKVLMAANHHADDYEVVAPFGNALRDWVADEAKRRNVNVLYDCSGVKYQNRYDHLVKGFKDAGYATQLIGVEASLHTAIDRMMHRFRQEGRAMPWHLVFDKHVNMPLSFMDAVRDRNLDKISLVADDGNKTSRYLMAETFSLPNSQVDAMKRQKKQGLASVIDGLLHSAESVFGLLSSTANEQTTPVDKNPAKGDDNQSFFTYDIGKPGEKRVLAVYNVGRLAGMAEKGLLNAHAASEQNLTHTPASMPFYMPRTEEGHEGAWKLRLLNQPPRAGSPGK